MGVNQKIFELKIRYCETIPKELVNGVLYVSKRFKLAIHLCACGCGGKAVTGLSDGNWTLTDNKGKVTLRPSIGNWKGESPYHAHYYITDSKIDWL